MVGLFAVPTRHVGACRVSRLSTPRHARWWFCSGCLIDRRLFTSVTRAHCLYSRPITQDGLGGDEVVDDWGQVCLPVLGRGRVGTRVEEVELVSEQDEGLGVFVLELVDDTLVDEVI